MTIIAITYDPDNDNDERLSFQFSSDGFIYGLSKQTWTFNFGEEQLFKGRRT